LLTISFQNKSEISILKPIVILSQPTNQATNHVRHMESRGKRHSVSASAQKKMRRDTRQEDSDSADDEFCSDHEDTRVKFLESQHKQELRKRDLAHEARFKTGVNHATEVEKEKFAAAAAMHKTQLDTVKTFTDQKHKAVCDRHIDVIAGLRKQLVELRASTKKISKLKVGKSNGGGTGKGGGRPVGRPPGGKIWHVDQKAYK
jgi:hypothetical protein